MDGPPGGGDPRARPRNVPRGRPDRPGFRRHRRGAPQAGFRPRPDRRRDSGEGRVEPVPPPRRPLLLDEGVRHRGHGNGDRRDGRDRRGGGDPPGRDRREGARAAGPRRPGGTVVRGDPHRGQPAGGGEGERPARVGPVPPRDVLPHEVRGSVRRVPSAGPQAAAPPGPDLLPRGDLLLRREDPPLRAGRNPAGRLRVRPGAPLRGDGPLGRRPVHPAGILPAGEFRLHHRRRSRAASETARPKGGREGGPGGSSPVALGRPRGARPGGGGGCRRGRRHSRGRGGRRRDRGGADPRNPEGARRQGEDHRTSRLWKIMAPFGHFGRHRPSAPRP